MGCYLILAGVMMQNETNSANSSSSEENFLLSLAAMFKGEFSLDWLEELAGMKASRILSLLEQEVQSGLLTRIKPAVYVFKNNEQRENDSTFCPRGKKSGITALWQPSSYGISMMTIQRPSKLQNIFFVSQMI